MSQTLLTLSPEHGGARFGPFGKGTLTIGSDAKRCQVVIAPALGAAPVHAVLTDTGNGWQVQPAQIGAAVFVRTAKGRVSPVTTATPVANGDAVVIGTQSGPALTVTRASVGPSTNAGRAKGRIPGSEHLSANAYQREARRQVESMVVRHPIGREVYRWWTRWKTGALLRPRYVIGAVVGLVGLFGAGCVGCFGLIGAILGLR